MKYGMNALIASTALAIAAPATAFAQAQQQPGAAQPQMEPVTEAEIKQYAQAEKKIATITKKWQQELNAVETQEAADQIREQAQSEMVAAIEQTGLSVQRYNEIYAQAQVDPALAEEIRSSA